MFTLWLTGLSGAGKTTIAEALKKTTKAPTYIIDGDVIRKGLNKDLGFSPEDRTENVRRIAELCAILRECNVINIVAAISPYRKDRELAKSMCKDRSKFFEVYVDCPLEDCIVRDVKGLYRKALDGEIKNFTGVQAPYEPPLNPDIHLKTNKWDVTDCVARVIKKIYE